MNQQVVDVAKAVFAHVSANPESDKPLFEAHYAPGFESIEADGTKHTGIDGVLGKHAWWMGAHTIHALKAEGPYCGNDGFAIVYEMDVEPKDGSWPRRTMREVGYYDVQDGKVTRERFCYANE